MGRQCLTIGWVESENRVLFAIQNKTEAKKSLDCKWWAHNNGNLLSIRDIGVIILPELIENDRDFYNNKEKTLLKLIDVIKELMNTGKVDGK